MALNHFIDQIENTQAGIQCKQKRPKNLDEVVSATLEMELYLCARTVSAIEFLKSSEEEDYSKQVVGTIASTNEMMGPALDKVKEGIEEKLQLLHNSYRILAPFINIHRQLEEDLVATVTR